MWIASTCAPYTNSFIPVADGRQAAASARLRHPAAALVVLVALSGCVRYVPQPIELTAHPAEYRSRRLDDPRLLDWVARWAPRPGGRRWSDRQLALAALGLRAELARSRAEWLAAVAGERSAGVRPPPGVEGSVERAVSGSEGRSPWVISLAGLFPLEPGGKRGARLQRARARAAIAEAELRFTAWRIARDAGAAAIGLAYSDADLAQARREIEALAEVEDRERARFQEASLSSAELARTGTEVQAARSAAAGTESEALSARAALAGILAVPLRALDSLVVVPERAPDCIALNAIGGDSLSVLALTRRPEIGRALADYALAESELRLEVARQYPELNLGPGFIWDQGVHRWTLALALPSLLGFRHRAAIREAERARAASAARVAEVQDALLAELETARARCSGATMELAAADSQVAVSARVEAVAEGAYRRGETSRLDPALASLSVVRAGRLQLAGRLRAGTAAAALRWSIGGWPAGDFARWPDPRRDQLMEGSAR
jgi:cobalt-zinc-cadmium efflux system outer membrane protein